MQPAVKTSEFWLTFLMLALAGVAMFADSSLSLRIVAMLAAATGLCVFTRARAALRITAITSKIARRTPPIVQSIDTKWALSIAKPSLNFILLGVLGALMLGGLGACSPTSAYVAADAATYNAIAPEYLGYVNADANLTAAQKTRRQNTIATWQLRIRQSGVTVTPATQPTTQP